MIYFDFKARLIYLKFWFYMSPLPIFFIFWRSVSSLTILSNIPLMNKLLFGVEYSLDISRYSLMVALTGIDGKFKNSVIPIFNMIISRSAIRSLSQFGVLPSISFTSFSSLRITFRNNWIAKSRSSSFL